MTDIQKASFSKRIFAFLADIIVAAILTAGIYLLMSTVLGVDKYNDKYNEIIRRYEEEYGVLFSDTAKMTREEYDRLPEQERKNYEAAVAAANADDEANAAIKASYGISFSIFAGGIVVSALLLEFLIPAFTGDGRTLGKLLFGLGVMRTGCTKLSRPVLFVRGVVGKGILEAALPAAVLVTSISGVTGIFGLILIGIFIVAEIVSFVRSGGSTMLHDVLADTVVIDWASQRIFNTEQERDEYEKKAAASAAEHDPYNDQTVKQDLPENK